VPQVLRVSSLLLLCCGCATMRAFMSDPEALDTTAAVLTTAGALAVGTPIGGILLLLGGALACYAKNRANTRPRG